MADYDKLFQPLTIRGRTVKNRVFLPAHGTGLAVKGQIGPDQMAYYQRRIEAGLGMLITEAHLVQSLENQNYAQLCAGSDSCIPGLRELVKIAEANDCTLVGQVVDEGRARAHSLDGSLDVAFAPSAVPDERYHTVPREMTVGMIQARLLEFRHAADRMVTAGLHGVELLAGYGFLHANFLSSHTNQRTDHYGGSFENRFRFLRETLEAMREALGPDRILGIRISSDEYAFDGTVAEDCLRIAEALDRDGLVDYINIIGGSAADIRSATYIVPPMFVENNFTAPVAALVRQRVRVPVLTVGRINQPQDAARLIADGSVDMVGMVRGFLSDPDFLAKVSAGRAEDVRACIGCNQACIGHRHSGHGISCIQYPESGRELAFPAVRSRAKNAKRVAIVGGGPGGMKAAVVAAERGHDVTLYERSGQLGGQARLAQSLPHRAEFGGLVTNLVAEIARYDVTVRTRTSTTAEMLVGEGYDAAILATGAVMRDPVGEFGDDLLPISAWDVVEGKANIGKNVVIYDWRCDWIGLGVAEKLALEGCHVRLCVNGETAGQTIQSFVRQHWNGRLHDLGVEILPYMRLFGSDGETVYMEHIMSKKPVILEECETLVVAAPKLAANELEMQLEGNIAELHVIGDCLAPRTAEEAVLDGLKAASAL